MKQLLRQMLVLILVGVRRSQFTMDAVRQSKAGEEGVQLFLVAQAFLSVEETQQELLLLAGERLVQRMVL